MFALRHEYHGSAGAVFIHRCFSSSCALMRCCSLPKCTRIMHHSHTKIQNVVGQPIIWQQTDNNTPVLPPGTKMATESTAVAWPGLIYGVTLLLLDGVLLPEHHNSVDQFTPLLTICSTMPSRVDADVEGLNISGNSSQPSFSTTSSWSSLSCGWVAHCSSQDSVVIFFVGSSMTEELKSTHAHLGRD